MYFLLLQKKSVYNNKKYNVFAYNTMFLLTIPKKWGNKYNEVIKSVQNVFFFNIIKNTMLHLNEGINTLNF